MTSADSRLDVYCERIVRTMEKEFKARRFSYGYSHEFPIDEMFPGETPKEIVQLVLLLAERIAKANPKLYSRLILEHSSSCMAFESDCVSSCRPSVLRVSDWSTFWHT